jgi:hypothetical protein
MKKIMEKEIMKKQLHENLIDFFLELLPDLKNVEDNVRDISERIIIWTVGLSTGSIALLIYQHKNLYFISSFVMKLSILCFVCSIIFGVIYRSTQPSVINIQTSRIFRFIGYGRGKKVEFYFPREITDIDTKENIANYLKEDMGLDYDEWLNDDYLDRNFWVDHYNRWKDFWIKTENNGLEYFYKELALLSNSTFEDVKNRFSSQSEDSKINNKLEKINRYSYMLTNIMFGIGVIFLSLGFVFYY